jgi:hypothetical protein
MKERNQFLEADGLVHETETHEWFLDKVSTNYARQENLQGIKLENIVAYVTRDKSNGQYERVLVNNNVPEVIFASLKLEDIGFHIDKLKTIKQFM